MIFSQLFIFPVHPEPVEGWFDRLTTSGATLVSDLIIPLSIRHYLSTQVKIARLLMGIDE